MKFKKFTEFIKENQTDPRLVIKMQEYVKSHGDSCPRCGEKQGKCICDERDYGSTSNLHRLGKGKLKKPANNFKIEESDTNEKENNG